VPTDRLLALLLASSLAALAAGLGALLAATRRADAGAYRRLGWASALAAGLMLGVAYAVMEAGLRLAPAAAGVAAVLGIAFVHLAGALPSTRAGWVAEAPPEPAGADGRPPGRRPLAVAASVLHSAPEGMAIGVAMALDDRFGMALALTLAVHNVSEGAVLGAGLADRGLTPVRAAALVVAAKTSQVALAAATFAAAARWPALLPWALGFAFGALVYLLLADLLPESYRRAGRTSIALVVSVAAGIAALLGGGAR
jgi:zinc transporter ZupT